MGVTAVKSPIGVISVIGAKPKTKPKTEPKTEPKTKPKTEPKETEDKLTIRRGNTGHTRNIKAGLLGRTKTKGKSLLGG